MMKSEAIVDFIRFVKFWKIFGDYNKRWILIVEKFDQLK